MSRIVIQGRILDGDRGAEIYWPAAGQFSAARCPRLPNSDARPNGSTPMTLARILFAALLMAAAPAARLPASENRPNVVYILCDDLGYGDVSCLNPQGKIPTPRIDRLAHEGMIFTDAHSGSSVCTPTRYGIMTGRYAWRTKLQQGVLQGYSPLLIEPGRTTVASLLKKPGYATAAIGKWHLGIGQQATDYSQPLTYGPNSVGFDYYFGIAASLDMPPYVFIKNETITAPLTGKAEDSPVPKYCVRDRWPRAFSSRKCCLGSRSRRRSSLPGKNLASRSSCTCHWLRRTRRSCPRAPGWIRAG